MVTIDLRDDTWRAPQRSSWFQRFYERATLPDAGSVVLRRTLLADVLAAAVAITLVVATVGSLVWPLDALIALVWPAALIRIGAYNRRRLLGNPVGWAGLATAASWVMAMCVVVDFVTAGPGLRDALRLVLLLWVATTVGRAAVSRWLRRKRRKGRLRIPVLARGSSRDVVRFLAQLRRDPEQPIKVVAIQVTDRIEVAAFGDLTIVPRATDPVDAAARNDASAMVILGHPDLPSDTLRRVIWSAEASGIDTMILPFVEPVAAPHVQPVRGVGLPSLSYNGPNRHLHSVKMAMDRVLAAGGLLVISPLLVLIALAVKLTSPGPVLFRQTRVGMNGRPFTMLKYRTMCQDAEALKATLVEQNVHDSGTLFKIKDDPRITRVGRVLRKYSLDELPQLINVARGEMSLVGPRPPLPDEVAKYPADSMRRFVVRPGITGLWQVSGRSDLDPVESARLDTHYVENWTFELDVKILVRTAKVVVLGSGAY
jgi:exopolysaccharide biosynthesis polyprenyl glycosylphosphotransferase